MSRHGGARTGAGRPKGTTGIPQKPSIERDRLKIQDSRILNNLIEHAEGAREMTATQVSAAVALLRKVLPDLSQADNKTQVLHRYVARVPDKKPDAVTWQKTAMPKQPILN